MLKAGKQYALPYTTGDTAPEVKGNKGGSLQGMRSQCGKSCFTGTSELLVVRRSINSSILFLEISTMRCGISILVILVGFFLLFGGVRIGVEMIRLVC